MVYSYNADRIAGSRLRNFSNLCVIRLCSDIVYGTVLDNMGARTWRLEEYVEVEADAARLGQSQNEWWAGRASMDVNGQR